MSSGDVVRKLRVTRIAVIEAFDNGLVGKNLDVLFVIIKVLFDF